jgi:heme-degrading monooxygenase HmoA
MHARVSILRPKGDQKEQVLRICEDVLAPAAERQKGFCGLLVMSDFEADRVLGITLWDTEADMLAGQHGEYLQEQISNLILFLAEPPVIEHLVVDVMS